VTTVVVVVVVVVLVLVPVLVMVVVVGEKGRRCKFHGGGVGPFKSDTVNSIRRT
jgi:hypothetical protein